MKNKLTIH